MLHDTFTIDTTADADAVRAYLADFRNQPHWRDDVLRSELESGQAGADGAVYAQHVRQGPGTADRRIRATLSADGRRVDFSTLGDAPVRASGESEIVPSGTGTTVRVRLRIEMTGPGKLLRPAISRVLKQRMPAYAVALKGRLDQLPSTTKVAAP